LKPVSSWTEIARLGAIPDKKITKAKAEGDSFEEEDNIVNARMLTMNFITRLNFKICQ
jgi:hypothetical protein